MVLEKIAVLKELTIFSVLLRTVLAMMTGIFLSRELGSTDPSRIAAQVISGIGFLGAGTILVTRQNQVKGLTTAAGLWADACLGLALGSGFYSGAIVGFAAIWCSLKILSTVDKRLGKTARVFGVYVEFVSIKDLSAFLDGDMAVKWTGWRLYAARMWMETGWLVQQ